MRELEREPSDTPHDRCRCAVIGRGRLGRTLATALARAGHEVSGPLGRGADGRVAGVPPDVVLLCVPDAEIAFAAAHLSPGALVGHCSGATPLEVLAPHEAFGLHPLMTVPEAGAELAGAGCAVAGSTPRALAAATGLARDLGMRPFALAESDRAAYHAAASVASNFLVSLEWAAERLAASAGAGREVLVPLVRATVENWAQQGAPAALTGPLVRGDEVTVARQRRAVAEAAPDLLPAFDALADLTRALAREGAGAPAPATPAGAAP
jgi:predicted short-subunit dehydrogenase-like oxidoreductase (DUF2520 family)